MILFLLLSALVMRGGIKQRLRVDEGTAGSRDDGSRRTPAATLLGFVVVDGTPCEDCSILRKKRKA